MAQNDVPMVPVKGQGSLALIVVLAIAAVGLLFIIISAFSQDNATATIDGDHAVYSHHLDAEAP